MEVDREGLVPIDEFVFLEAARQGSSTLANNAFLAGDRQISYKWGSIYYSIIDQLAILRLKGLQEDSTHE